MKGKSDGSQKRRLLTSVAVVAIFLFLYFYFGSRSSAESALEYGSRSLKKLGSSYLGNDENTDSRQDDTSFKLGLDDSEDGTVSKSFPVSSLCASLLCGYHPVFSLMRKVINFLLNFVMFRYVMIGIRN